MASRHEVFVGERRVAGVPASDRGVAYGDGVFETMRGHRGGVPWWEAHWARLALGAQRLGLVLPREALVRGEAARLLDGRDAVVKLVLTRGDGTRGYAPVRDARPTWILSTHPLPAPPRADGLALRWCATRLSHQPLLAGIKHCNRLEQVLARGEWPAPGEPGGDAFDEGLLCDADGHVAGAIAANVFVLREGQWCTPPVDRCGVAGTCRGWWLRAAGAIEQPLTRRDVEAADAVVLCNALRGILPVARLEGREWPRHPAVATVARRLAAAHPAFA
ncbi:MAG TPA: aminodeoxychorismate lyase [Xanthomonadaceae bacterium]|nr:aminodeoxychorismate lyase [Xanthomonadaceae bacterium]